MPWKASSVMEERLRFVARLLDGEAMTEVCREFGISRKTGYKIFDRYKEHGLEALSDRSRRPVRFANQLPQQVEILIVRLKSEKPHWGARKIRELLVRRLDGDIKVPAKSTIHAVLDRHGLVKRGGGPRHRARGTPLSQGTLPNDLWCADFKGEFKLGNGRYCYPLTVTDHASRFLLLCEALDSTREEPAIVAFERLFRDRGLPLAIRSDGRRAAAPGCDPHGRQQADAGRLQEQTRRGALHRHEPHGASGSLMASEGMCVAAGAGVSGSSTILGAHRVEDHLMDLWRADRCPALSREQRVSMIKADASPARWSGRKWSRWMNLRSITRSAIGGKSEARKPDHQHRPCGRFGSWRRVDEIAIDAATVIQARYSDISSVVETGRVQIDIDSVATEEASV
ncbi:transposase [Bradyrhizobium sp. AZCC 1588]